MYKAFVFIFIIVYSATSYGNCNSAFSIEAFSNYVFPVPNRGETIASPITAVFISNSGRLIVSGHKDGTVRFYDTDGIQFDYLKQESEEITSLDFNHESSVLIVKHQLRNPRILITYHFDIKSILDPNVKSERVVIGRTETFGDSPE